MSPNFGYASEAGSSLVEVVLAAMILSLTTIILVGGLLTSRLVQDRAQSKADLLAQFDSAVSEIALQPYQECWNSPRPYLTPSTPSGFQIDTPSVLRSGNWIPCSTTDTGVVQLLTVRAKIGDLPEMTEKLVKAP